MMGRALQRIFDFFATLKLAVIVLVLLTGSLAVATSLESYYDTPTAQYWVYQSWWFHALLGFLALNILIVALSRLPWKKKHIPFLLAHLGIEMVIFGSWITQNYGLDGNLRLAEGETGAMVEEDRPTLMIADFKEVHSIPVRWMPPSVHFTPYSVKRDDFPYDLTIDQFISRAEPLYGFIENPKMAPGQNSHAVHLQLTGGPMRITQDFWLWDGEASWRAIQMGPAWFAMSQAKNLEPGHKPNQPGLLVVPEADGSLSWLARTSDGKAHEGHFSAREIEGGLIQPGWKGDVKLTVLKWLPQAIPKVTYQPAREQYGPNVPPSAIHVISGAGGTGSELWLGMGDHSMMKIANREMEVGYFPKRVVMPFALKLERFTIDHNPGTDEPAAYSSRVVVVDREQKPPVTISMNEPLHYRGLTLYQASYENPQAAGVNARPTVSIFAVNRDPGRSLKYYGSLLIVLGSILLFAMKYWGKRRAQPAKGNSS